MIQEIKALLKEIRRNWEIDVLGKRPRKKRNKLRNKEDTYYLFSTRRRSNSQRGILMSLSRLK